MNAELRLDGVIGDDYGGITAEMFASKVKALGNVATIELFINSPGGDFFQGVSIYNQLIRQRATINVTVEGLAASAASVIAMAGRRISIGSNSMLMIHNSWTMAVGSKRDLREQADILAKLDGTLIETYRARTGKSAGQIQAWLDQEFWMTGKEAVDLGFANDVLPLRTAANWDNRVAAAYRNVPASFRHAPASSEESDWQVQHEIRRRKLDLQRKVARF